MKSSHDSFGLSDMVQPMKPAGPVRFETLALSSDIENGFCPSVARTVFRLSGLLNRTTVLATLGQKPFSISELNAKVSNLTGPAGFIGWTMSDNPNESWELFIVNRGRFRVNPYTGDVISRAEGLGFLGWVGVPLC